MRYRKPGVRKVARVREAGPIDCLLPQAAKPLLTGSGRDFAERLGADELREAVLRIMLGENVRAQTEPLSRRRLAQGSGSMIAMFAQGSATIEGFIGRLSELATKQLMDAPRNDTSCVWPAQWLIGLTGKQVQNVLRSKPEALARYLEDFEEAVAESAEQCERDHGPCEMTLAELDVLDGKGSSWIGTALLA